jgi:hypothetical protein
MGKIINKRISAATLIETIIALVIILTITGITVTVFVQVTMAGFSTKKLKAAAMIDRQVVSTRYKKTFFDEEFREQNLVLRKQVLESGHSENISRINFSVYDEEGVLIEAQNIYYLIK